MKQTAVEWLIKQLENHNGITRNAFENVIQQAKAMEKEQMEYLWYVANQAGRFEGKGIAEENWLTFEQYYNETFKKEQ